MALLDAVKSTAYAVEGEKILAKALLAPFKTILENAGLDEIDPLKLKKGWGIDVTCGCERKMIDSGIIDPVLVTKSALKNAISVVSTIISADCVISNIRIENASS